MKIAIIKTGGKQYIVKEGDILKIEKINAANDAKLDFDKVLLMADENGNEVKIGTPFIANAKIEAKVLEQGRAKKIRVIHYKPKTRQHKVYGHRQPFTKVQIEKI